MKRILEYGLYQSHRAYSLMEAFSPQGNPKWPSNWKEMDLWKELEAMGFEDVTTPIQAKNGTIMLVNKEFPHMYPAGVVLQASGYIRDKAARSGFIKQYPKNDFSLTTVFNYIKDRWSKEHERLNPKDAGPLTREQIFFIGSITNAPWRWNPSTNSVDIDGKVDIRFNDKPEVLGSFKFGKVKGEFSMFLGDTILDSIEDFAPESVKSISIYSGSDMNGGIISTKGFPKKIKEDAVVYGLSLENIEDIPFDIKSLRTSFFEVSPYNIETALLVLEKGSVRTFHRVGGVIEIKNDGEIKRDSEARDLILTALSEENLDLYFKKNPLKIHYLDKHPDIKAGVLKRTGIRDLSRLGKNLDTGWM
jgi:hypothetical protein